MTQRGRPRGRPQAAASAADLERLGRDPQLARLAERVGSLRMERGWTVQQLADEAGLHHDQMRKIERAERDPHLSTLVRLAITFGYTDLGSLVGPIIGTMPDAAE